MFPVDVNMRSLRKAAYVSVPIGSVFNTHVYFLLGGNCDGDAFYVSLLHFMCKAQQPVVYLCVEQLL